MTSIKNWVLSKFAGPTLPILSQVYKVAVAVEGTLHEVLRSLVVGSPAYVNADAILGAVLTVKDALANVIVFLGGTIPATTTANPDLQSEIDKLKKLLS